MTHESPATRRIVQVPVVVLNPHYTGLAIARGLQGCGAAPIYALGANETLFGNFSRYCKYMWCPDTALAPEQCRDFLIKFAARFDTRPLLFPTRDHDLQFLSKYYAELEERYVVIASAPEMLQSILNKASLYRVAHELGIPYPATAWINSRADLDSVREELVFPIIAKPVYSTQWRKTVMWELVGRQKAVIIQNYEELRRFYARIEPVDSMMHVQEFIPGADTDLVIFGSYVSPNSSQARYFTGRKLLQYPARSGTGVAVQACPVPDIVDASLRLLSRLGYRGVSEIEYKYDRRTDKYVLIEMNPRFWDQHGLGAAAGVNLARCLFLDLTTGQMPEQRQDPQPLTWIAEDGFVVSFLDSLKNKSYPLADFLHALKGRTTVAVFDRRDWRPAVTLASQLVRNAGNGLWQRITAMTSKGTA